MEIHSLIPLLAAIIYTPLFVVLIVNRPWQKQHKLFIIYLVAATCLSISEFLLLSDFLIEYKLQIFKAVICSSVWMGAQLYHFARTFLRLPAGFGVRFGYFSLLLIVTLAILGIAPPSIIVEEGRFVGHRYHPHI